MCFVLFRLWCKYIFKRQPLDLIVFPLCQGERACPALAEDTQAGSQEVAQPDTLQSKFFLFFFHYCFCLSTSLFCLSLFWVFVSLSLSLPLCVSFSLSLYLSMPPYLSLSLYLKFSVYLNFSLSLSVLSKVSSKHFSLSLSLSKVSKKFLSLSLSLSKVSKKNFSLCLLSKVSTLKKTKQHEFRKCTALGRRVQRAVSLYPRPVAGECSHRGAFLTNVRPGKQARELRIRDWRTPEKIPTFVASSASINYLHAQFCAHLTTCAPKVAKNRLHSTYLCAPKIRVLFLRTDCASDQLCGEVKRLLVCGSVCMSNVSEWMKWLSMHECGPSTY